METVSVGCGFAVMLGRSVGGAWGKGNGELERN